MNTITLVQEIKGKTVEFDVFISAWTAARRVYEGHGRTDGERDRDPYLARAWPTFAALRASGEFEQWVEVLLAPLLQHMEAAKEEKKGARA